MKSLQGESIDRLTVGFSNHNSAYPRLPSLVTASDVREVVRYLRQHAEGVPLMEANEAFRKRILDARKRIAYESWGIVAQTPDNRIVLGELGREFAARLAVEMQIYRQILQRTKPYVSALEWIHQSGLNLVTWPEVDRFWSNNYPEQIDLTIREGQAVTFFDLCHAAEIGQITVGRKGHPARLRIYRHELSTYLSNLW